MKTQTIAVMSRRLLKEEQQIIQSANTRLASAPQSTRERKRKLIRN
jgi:hypothetical protein